MTGKQCNMFRTRKHKSHRYFENVPSLIYHCTWKYLSHVLLLFMASYEYQNYLCVAKDNCFFFSCILLNKKIFIELSLVLKLN